MKQTPITFTNTLDPNGSWEPNFQPMANKMLVPYGHAAVVGCPPIVPSTPPFDMSGSPRQSCSRNVPNVCCCPTTPLPLHDSAKECFNGTKGVLFVSPPMSPIAHAPQILSNSVPYYPLPILEHMHALMLNPLCQEDKLPSSPTPHSLHTPITSPGIESIYGSNDSGGMPPLTLSPTSDGGWMTGLDYWEPPYTLSPMEASRGPPSHSDNGTLLDKQHRPCHSWEGPFVERFNAVQNHPWSSSSPTEFYLRDVELDYPQQEAFTDKVEGVYNDGLDNEDHLYICHKNEILFDDENRFCYEALGTLGHGEFGQVLKCLKRDVETFYPLGYFAVKIVKNIPLYIEQALAEIRILVLIRDVLDPHDDHGIVRLDRYFQFKNHLCLVFELLDENIYQLLRRTHFEGLPLKIVQQITAQLIDAACLLGEANITHCDIKPENVLIEKIDYYPLGRRRVLGEAGRDEARLKANEETVLSGCTQSPRGRGIGGNSISRIESRVGRPTGSGDQNVLGDTLELTLNPIIENEQVVATSVASSMMWDTLYRQSNNQEIAPSTGTGVVDSMLDVFLKIKLIDFGSAHMMKDATFSYVQSRFYRAPEVILGLPCTPFADMWSIGCMVFELFFGLPLFPGNSEFDQLRRIIDFLGHPPLWMIEKGVHAKRYFNRDTFTLQENWVSGSTDSTLCDSQESELSSETGEFGHEDLDFSSDCTPSKTMISPEKRTVGESSTTYHTLQQSGGTDVWVDSESRREPSKCKGTFERHCIKIGDGKATKNDLRRRYANTSMGPSLSKLKRKKVKGRKYFSLQNLDSLLDAEMEGTTHDSDRAADRKCLVDFVDFLKKLLKVEPSKRITAKECVQHPFVKPIMPLRKVYSSKEETLLWKENVSAPDDVQWTTVAMNSSNFPTLSMGEISRHTVAYIPPQSTPEEAICGNGYISSGLCTCHKCTVSNLPPRTAAVYSSNRNDGYSKLNELKETVPPKFTLPVVRHLREKIKQKFPITGIFKKITEVTNAAGPISKPDAQQGPLNFNRNLGNADLGSNRSMLLSRQYSFDEKMLRSRQKTSHSHQQRETSGRCAPTASVVDSHSGAHLKSNRIQMESSQEVASCPNNTMLHAPVKTQRREGFPNRRFRRAMQQSSRGKNTSEIKGERAPTATCERKGLDGHSVLEKGSSNRLCHSDVPPGDYTTLENRVGEDVAQDASVAPTAHTQEEVSMRRNRYTNHTLRHRQDNKKMLIHRSPRGTETRELSAAELVVLIAKNAKASISNDITSPYVRPTTPSLKRRNLNA